ncbi:MAG: hypothetical protein GWO39_12605, partial [Gammaproteobacteria bacterium]|nr:hypothetical protein [Gammaproteobacteria bacterium]NIY33156.1 hypothetical protein [Gammaproteobacteria bacterium]
MCPEYGARDPDRVLEVKQRLDGTLSTYHCRRLASAPGEVVVYFPLQRAFDLHGVALPVGSA